MPEAAPRIEEFQVNGDQLLKAVKDLVHQGNIRRIAIRNSRGVTLLEIPLIVGVAGAVLAPVWAAVGALAALVVKCTLAIERTEAPPPKGAPKDPPKDPREELAAARGRRKPRKKA